MPRMYEKKSKKRRKYKVVKDPMADYQPIHGQTAAMREETELRSERKKGGKVLNPIPQIKNILGYPKKVKSTKPSDGNTYVQNIYK